MSYVSWIRSRVGSRKIFMVFATVIVQDEDGRILLQRRTDFEFWGLPGGALELDEDIVQCARRELLEESGITVGPLSLLGIYTHPKFDVIYPNGDQVQQFTICFVGQWQGGMLRSDGMETVAHRFFSLAETAVLPLPPWYRAMVADLGNGGSAAFTPPFAQESVVDQIAQIRQFVGHERIIGVGAFVVATREDGRWLMIQRRDNGAWAMPAGFCDLGENVAYTAVRELREETGYEVQIERLIGVYSSPHFHVTYPNGDQVKNVGATFRASVIGGDLQPNVQETAAVAWVSPDDVLRRVDGFLYPLVVQILRHFDEGVFVI